MGIVLGNLQKRFPFLRTTNTRMNLVMKDLTMTTTTMTLGNGYLNLIKRNLEGNGRNTELTRLLGRMSG